MRADYFKHFIVGGAIAFALLPFIGAYALAVVFVLAVAKEFLWDLAMGKGHFDYKDIVFSMGLPVLFWFCTMMCKC